MQILKRYSQFAEIIFYCFIFGVISFGRAFSILHINIAGFPVFITELALLLCLPLIFIFRRIVLDLPKVFLLVLASYCIFGWFYFFLGISQRNILALRDGVFCVYPIFSLIALIISSRIKGLEKVIFVIVAANIFSIISGIFYLYNIYPIPGLNVFLTKTKTFNLGFSYGLALSFLFIFYGYIKPKFLRYVALILISFNLCMFLVLSVRTLWLACLVIIGLYFLIIGRKFIKIIIKVILPVAILYSIFVSFDSSLLEGKPIRKFMAKIISLNVFTRRSFDQIVLPKNTGAKDLSASTLAEPELSTFKRENLDHIQWRLAIWKQSLDFGLKRPLFGRGYGVYPEYFVEGRLCTLPYPRLLNSGITPAHNHLISIFYKMGLLGLVLFIFINFFVFISGLKFAIRCSNYFIKNFLFALLSTFIFWHTMAFFFDMIDSPPTSVLLWIIIGFIFGALKVAKERTV